MDNNPTSTPAQCPFRGTRIGGALGSKPQTDDWWPNRLQVEMLHQNPPQANPLRDFNYQEAFEKIDFQQLKSDIKALPKRFKGMVASRLWQLWTSDDPHGLALRRYLSNRRRSWRSE